MLMVQKRRFFLFAFFLVGLVFFPAGVLAEEDGKICCSFPGPADEPLYEWRLEVDCQSPEGVFFGDGIVEDSFCEKNFDDNPKYRCEDMGKEDCESAKDCESIEGPSFCEGDVCTTDMVWKGCRYKYEEVFEELKKEYGEEEVDPGITPDSLFYFLDGIFGDTREEKIAEVEAMIAKGDFESARKALLKYMKYAKEFEDNPDPEKRDEARRAAAAIHRMLEKIKSKIPEDEREEFYEDVLDTEGGIVTAVEISEKIKELCTQLAELDPLEYSKMCKTDDDAPRWQRKLDEDLSAEQEEIARKFVGIMKQCFETSGQDCACEEIPFYDFSIACSKAAPLAAACDVEGDEAACDELDNLEMPELPDWLQPIWEDLDDEMMEAQFNMHMPDECVEAGVTDPKECGKVMINTHSPLECRAALLESGCDSERECREICDKIMMEQHAPECVEKGITDPEECKKFYEESGFRGPEGPRDMGPGFGPDCMSIEDSMERLDCYDNKENQMGEYYGPTAGERPEGEITWQCKENRIHWPPDCETFMREEWPEQERKRMEEGEIRREQEGDWMVKQEECINKCESQDRPWDFSGGECICGEPGQYYGGPEIGFYDESECKDGCQDECPGASRTGCVDNKCECYYEEKDEEQDEEKDEESKCDDCASQCESIEGQRLKGTDCVNGVCECYYESDEPDYGPGEGGDTSDRDTTDSSGNNSGITGSIFLDYYD